MATPFIDILDDQQQQRVAKFSKGPKRPSYFSAEIAKSQPSSATPGSIKISLDLEAVLILLPANTKQGLLSFIQTSLDAVSNLDQKDFSLFTEVVTVRKESYPQINTDSGKVVEDYDLARSQVLTFIENRARQGSNSASEATGVVVPDLSTLFVALSESYDRLSRPDELALHDRIVDAGFLFAIQRVATDRSRELSSWVSVIQAYMVT